MTTFTQEQLDTPLAALEDYDLPLRTIAALERADYLYVRDLEGVTARKLQELHYFGRGMVKQLTRALRAFMVGDPPKKGCF